MSDQTKAIAVRSCFVHMRTAMDLLRSLGVIRSQRPTSDFAEWLVCELVGGRLADNKVQHGWDVMGEDGRRISVKSHAKALDNPTRWTAIGTGHAEYDELAIVVMTEQFLVKEMYRIPSEVVGLKAPANRRLRWDSVADYRSYPPVDGIPQDLRPLFG